MCFNLFMYFLQKISLHHMLIVFDSKSSLTHYTFDQIKCLSQLHICIALLNILFLKIYVQKLIKDHFLSSPKDVQRFVFHGICSINQAQINCNLNQFETMSMCTGCTDWKMQILSALNQYNLCSKVDLLLMKIGFPGSHF
jgi:hypothetical protein